MGVPGYKGPVALWFLSVCWSPKLEPHNTPSLPLRGSSRTQTHTDTHTHRHTHRHRHRHTNTHTHTHRGIRMSNSFHLPKNGLKQQPSLYYHYFFIFLLATAKAISSNHSVTPRDLYESIRIRYVFIYSGFSFNLSSVSVSHALLCLPDKAWRSRRSKHRPTTFIGTDQHLV